MSDQQTNGEENRKLEIESRRESIVEGEYIETINKPNGEILATITTYYPRSTDGERFYGVRYYISPKAKDIVTCEFDSWTGAFDWITTKYYSGK